MRPNYGILFLILASIAFILLLGNSKAPAYRPMPAFVRESFTNGGDAASYDPLESMSSGPAPRKVNSGEPYTLLEKLPTTNQAESHYGENALSCYAKDFWRTHERTGNYRQETNNYQKTYPDSCTSGRGEFVLSFYKGKPYDGRINK
jgi:hypothetical protein